MSVNKFINNVPYIYRHCSGLVVIILILYSFFLVNNSGFFGDDHWMLTDNPFVKSMNLNNLYKVFTEPYMAQYSPLNTFLYCLLYRFFGLDTFVYHLVCILIHIGNTILVYLIVIELLGFRSSNYKHGHPNDSSVIHKNAFWVALFFGISPMQVESVAWISASKIVLYSLFFLAGILAYLKHLKAGERRYLIYCAFFLLFAYLSKEQAVLLPLVLLLIHYFCIESFKRSDLLFFVPLFLLAGMLGIISMMFQNKGFHGMFESYYYPFWQRLFLACYTLTQYMSKMILPVKLSHDYPFPMYPGDPLPNLYLFYPITIITILLLVIRFLTKRRFPVLTFGILFFIVNLILTLHLFPLGRSTVMADRYIYISEIGFYFIIGFYYFKLKNWNGLKVNYSRFLVGLTACYILFTIIVTFWYLQQWTISA